MKLQSNPFILIIFEKELGLPKTSANAPKGKEASHNTCFGSNSNILLHTFKTQWREHSVALQCAWGHESHISSIFAQSV